jgi:hypothetical protein
MKTKLNYDAVLAAARAEKFCDVGHYYCPTLRHDGALIFRSGILRPCGLFEGARRLAELLADPPNCLNLTSSGAMQGGIYHYPPGVRCDISNLPEEPRK